MYTQKVTETWCRLLTVPPHVPWPAHNRCAVSIAWPEFVWAENTYCNSTFSNYVFIRSSNSQTVLILSVPALYQALLEKGSLFASIFTHGGNKSLDSLPPQEKRKREWYYRKTMCHSFLPDWLVFNFSSLSSCSVIFQYKLPDCCIIGFDVFVFEKASKVLKKRNFGRGVVSGRSAVRIMLTLWEGSRRGRSDVSAAQIYSTSM